MNEKIEITAKTANEKESKSNELSKDEKVSDQVKAPLPSSLNEAPVSSKVPTKEEVMPVETQTKKETEKLTSKSDSSSSKKDKSKSPDKEVKKEEGSGGGFFKRFWK